MTSIGGWGGEHASNEVLGFPRRIDTEQMTEAELAITKAMEEVEKAGCHPFLTDAVVLLSEAREKVADFVDKKELKMSKLTLNKTCGACPEQYDVFLEGENVGYMRLRHGYFTAECQGKIVYEGTPKGDGIFEPEERDRYLHEACQAILKDLNSRQENLYEIEE